MFLILVGGEYGRRPSSPKEPVQLQSSAEIEAANQKKAVWVCRVLSLFAALLACAYARVDHSLTALAFATLGIELRTLRLTAIVFVGIAAFLAATGQRGSAGAVLGVLLFFSAVVVWRGRQFTNPQAEPKEGEARTRRLISRTVPFLLLFFVALPRTTPLTRIGLGLDMSAFALVPPWSGCT